MAMLFVFAFAFSQRQSNIVVKEFGPEYRLHYTLYPAENAGKGELQLKLEMPYDEILFIKNNSHYKAKFEFSVMIHDNQIQVINENFIREVSLDEFRLTNSGKKNSLLKKPMFLIQKNISLTFL